LANVPGDQKLAPLSSADEEPWPKTRAKATSEIVASKLRERLLKTTVTGTPTLFEAIVVDRTIAPRSEWQSALVIVS
jgi:hypothetical protein